MAELGRRSDNHIWNMADANTGAKRPEENSMDGAQARKLCALFRTAQKVHYRIDRFASEAAEASRGFDEIKPKIEELKSKAAKLKSKEDDLDAKIHAIMSRNTGSSPLSDSAETELADLNRQLSEAKSDNTKAGAELAELRPQVSSLKDKIDSIESHVQILEKTLFQAEAATSANKFSTEQRSSQKTPANTEEINEELLIQISTLDLLGPQKVRDAAAAFFTASIEHAKSTRETLKKPDSNAETLKQKSSESKRELRRFLEVARSDLEIKPSRWNLWRD
ncbi:hypothetical protein [Saccharopolyspora sp. NPDC049426]|uniref:hypothetical protein n=1 Tax=Saccharopolyspora sp. NPDC049426 TaxID=3155652 RepID=UPI003421EC6A